MKIKNKNFSISVHASTGSKARHQRSHAHRVSGLPEVSKVVRDRQCKLERQSKYAGVIYYEKEVALLSGGLLRTAPSAVSWFEENRINSMRDLRIPRPWDSPTGARNGLDHVNQSQQENIMQPFLTFANDHQNIQSTNYLDSEGAAKGFLYLSWNAGAGRLLIPDNQLHMLAEMRTGKYVVVSAGPWPEQRRTNGLELMFEDNTDSPFSWHFGAEQCDRMLPSKDEGGGFVIAAWGRDGLLATWPGKFRKVKRIPCLLPWAGA